jgi:sodium-coupled neutral amino acid transporter 11
LIVAVGAIFYWSVMTLVKAAKKAKAETIQELADKCFGRMGLIVLNSTLILLTWGGLIVFVILMGDIVPKLFRLLNIENDILLGLLGRRSVLTIISVFVIFPIASLRSLDGLAKFSYVALAAIVFIIFSVVITSFLLPETDKGNIKEPLSFINLDGISTGISSLAFAYCCQQNSLLNYHAMKKKSLRVFQQCFLDVQTFSVLMTLLVGFSYVSLREKSSANIFDSFPDTLLIICQILFVVDLMLTYPLESFVLRDTIEQAFYQGREYSRLRHLILTGGIILSTLLVSYSTCDIGMIIDLFGGVAASLLAFVIPSACLLRICFLRAKEGGDKMRLWSKISHGLLIAGGIGMIFVTIYLFIVELNGEKEAKDCHW